LGSKAWRKSGGKKARKQSGGRRRHRHQPARHRRHGEIKQRNGESGSESLRESAKAPAKAMAQAYQASRGMAAKISAAAAKPWRGGNGGHENGINNKAWRG